jgi:PDZ domain
LNTPRISRKQEDPFAANGPARAADPSRTREVHVRQKISCWTVLVLVACVVPALAGEDRCTEPDIQTCLNHMAAKRTQGWLGLDFDRSDPGVIKVAAVTPLSPASRAGFRPGDVLLTLNGASLTDDAALAKAKGEWLPKQVVMFTVQRSGFKRRIPVTLGKYDDRTFAMMVGMHMLEYHVQVPAMISEAPETEATAATH